MTDTMLKTGQLGCFTTTVPPQQLMAMLHRYYHSAGNLLTHRALARSRLDQQELSADHPYARFMAARGVADWTDHLRWRGEIMDDMIARGIQEPVDAYFDDDGTTYFHGYHRLAFALEAGIDGLSVTFRLLSPRLKHVCDALFSIYRQTPYSVYQPLRHDLFRLLPVHQPELPAKSASIASAVPAGRFVDLGCHLGYMTRRLNLYGWEGFGIDSDGALIALQPHLVAIGERPAALYHESVEQFIATSSQYSCTAVAMGVLHHFMATEERVQRQFLPLAAWLHRNCTDAVVEMAYGKHVDQPGGEATEPHLRMTGTGDAVALWAQHGFTATSVYVDGGSGRETFRLQRIRT